ncbi:MAG: hypothetical protein ACE5FS_10150 [Paracoccaceae bacterium]
MAKTLLNGVNEVFKRIKLIQGDAAALTSLTDSARQHSIDLAIQIWNEVVDEIYDTSGAIRPNGLAENTITLATSDRDYALQSDVNKLLFPLLDETNGRKIFEYEGGYLAMVQEQIVPANWTGLPLYGTIRPTDGELYLDRIPTSDENGLVYKYRYLKDMELSVAADTFPFGDVVFRSLVPVVAEIIRQESDKETDFKSRMSILRQSHRFGVAVSHLNQRRPRESW